MYIHGSEEDMCKAFWRLIQNLQLWGKLGKYDIFCISNNQRSSKAWAQGKDKLLGVTPGVADYCVPGHGFMEAKRYTLTKTGKLSTASSTQSLEQEAFQAAMEAKGVKYAIFRTPNEGVDILGKWLGIEL